LVGLVARPLRTSWEIVGTRYLYVVDCGDTSGLTRAC
jgi:hypothetical protein